MLHLKHTKPFSISHDFCYKTVRGYGHIATFYKQNQFLMWLVLVFPLQHYPVTNQQLSFKKKAQDSNSNMQLYHVIKD